MFVPFDTLPAHTRVWIYQANRVISPSERDVIFNTLTSFTQQWMVHGKPMKTSFKIDHDHFIILAADEGYNAASGCSIDDSVRVIKQLGEALGIDFFDRTKIAFKSGGDVALVALQDLKQTHATGIWQADTITFNNLAATKDALDREWLVPSGQTWLKRYLPAGAENIKHT
jgi:hypothetical protein